MFRLVTLASLLAVLVSSATAFAPASLPRMTSVISKPLHVLLSEEETEAIMKSASDCAEGECSIDDVSGFIAELEEQQSEMKKRLEEIMNMVSHLQHLNEKKTRDKDEVRQYVKDLLRVFNSSSGGWATGFSGDIGDGPTTAYDALPPKKWKASP